MVEQKMVERVAEAIKDAAVIVLDYSDVTYLEDPMVVARAAIAAIEADYLLVPKKTANLLRRLRVINA